VARYCGIRRTLTAHLTYREGLRDIEACLTAQAGKLYQMGFRELVHRSTQADANGVRDWRIFADIARRPIAQARRLYAGDSLGVDLGNTVYALARRRSVSVGRYFPGRTFVRPRRW
jgi:hypothetical protein